ncbi:MAG: hypothetical protein MZU97_12290 [Bacillus subtilis]|nr:hypothetical protein [Bacillus subtilis]
MTGRTAVRADGRPAPGGSVLRGTSGRPGDPGGGTETRRPFPDHGRGGQFPAGQEPLRIYEGRGGRIDIMKSMTGFARREIDTPFLKGSLTIKSYNNRYLEISVYLPPYLAMLESRLQGCRRGRRHPRQGGGGPRESERYPTRPGSWWTPPRFPKSRRLCAPRRRPRASGSLSGFPTSCPSTG